MYIYKESTCTDSAFIYIAACLMSEDLDVAETRDVYF